MMIASSLKPGEARAGQGLILVPGGGGAGVKVIGGDLGCIVGGFDTAQ